MANPWFRLWNDMVNDPKFRTIARVSKQEISRVISVYLHMMTCASNAAERGRTEGWCDEDVATALDINTDDVTAIRDAMQGRVLDGDYLTGWEKRQPLREDDGAAARAKAWREAQKAAKEQDQTQPNAAERNETLEEKRLDTDKEEINRTKTKAPASPLHELVALGVDGQVASDWIKHRKAKRASAAQTVIDDRKGQAAIAGITLEDALRIEVSRGWQGFNAEWLKPGPARASPAKPQLDLAAAQKAANEEAKRRLFGNDDGRTIDA